MRDRMPMIVVGLFGRYRSLVLARFSEGCFLLRTVRVVLPRSTIMRDKRTELSYPGIVMPFGGCIICLYSSISDISIVIKATSTKGQISSPSRSGPPKSPIIG